jgi:hypothetical protein
VIKGNNGKVRKLENGVLGTVSAINRKFCFVIYGNESAEVVKVQGWTVGRKRF